MLLQVDMHQLPAQPVCIVYTGTACCMPRHESQGMGWPGGEKELREHSRREAFVRSLLHAPKLPALISRSRALPQWCLACAAVCVENTGGISQTHRNSPPRVPPPHVPSGAK